MTHYYILVDRFLTKKFDISDITVLKGKTGKEQLIFDNRQDPVKVSEIVSEKDCFLVVARVELKGRRIKLFIKASKIAATWEEVLYIVKQINIAAKNVVKCKSNFSESGFLIHEYHEYSTTI